MAKNNTPPSSLFSRSIKIMGMASKLAAKEVAQRVSGAAQKKYDELTPPQIKRRIDQARILTEGLSQLKGAAMKAGQLLSIDASDFLPPEAVEILSQLQSQSTQMKFEVIESELKREWGEEKFEKVRNLSYSAIASASIGQVHRGEIDGRPVAIKVQYPGVDRSIDSDLKLLKKITDQFLSIAGKPIQTESTFEELRKVLINETNYLYEKEWLEFFRERLKEDPRFIVPQVLSDYTTSHVLTMSFEEGITLTQWLKTEPSTEMKRALGARVLDLFMIEFLQFGAVQTDPNFANFLIRSGEGPDGFKLVLLDFGATLPYTHEFRSQYAKLLKKMEQGTHEEIMDEAYKFELISPKEPRETQDNFIEMLKISLRPFQDAHQPFQFANAEFEKESRDITIRFTQSLKYSSPPRNILFLHRKLGGVFNLLKKMKVELNLRPYWDLMVSDSEKNGGV